jgi:membrane-associated phospholipid phosphatase
LWFAGLIAFVVWAGWTKFRVLRQRALVSLLLLWIGGGTIGAWAVSSVGPCYYPEVVQGPNPYEQLLAQLDSYESPPLGARINQVKLLETRRADRWAQFAGISAMPSMHVGLAVLFALVAWQCSRVLGLLLWGYAIIIQIGSVVLAWHYAIDGYVGALLAIICWLAAPSMARIHSSRVDEMQSR